MYIYCIHTQYIYTVQICMSTSGIFIQYIE